MVDGRRLAVGNAKFLGELGIDTQALASEAERLRDDGATAIFLAVNGKPAGVIAVADPIKATTPAALKALAAGRHAGGDADRRQPHDGAAVAQALGITEVEAEVLPEQKSAVIEKLSAGPRGGDGRRRRQRRAGAGRGGRRHRHGHRHRRGDRERRHHTGQRRSRRHRARARCRPPSCATSARTCSSRSSTTRLGVPIAAGVLYPPSACCCRRSSPRPRWRCRRSA